VTTAWVDGTDLSTYGTIEDLGGLYSFGGRRGGNYVVPGRDGEIPVEKPRAAFPVSIGITIFGTTGSDYDAQMRNMNAAWLAIEALCDPDDGLVTLKRRLYLPSAVTKDQTCNAELSGTVEPTLLAMQGARCVLTFTNLDGKWTDV
jgi:hypothetical protein